MPENDQFEITLNTLTGYIDSFSRLPEQIKTWGFSPEDEVVAKDYFISLVNVLREIHSMILEYK